MEAVSRALRALDPAASRAGHSVDVPRTARQAVEDKVSRFFLGGQNLRKIK